MPQEPQEPQVPRTPKPIHVMDKMDEVDFLALSIELTSRLETESDTPKAEKIKYKNKITEARACVSKAIINLDNSRNLKTEIKNEVKAAVNRLFVLIKEYEKESIGRTGQTQIIDKQDNDSGREIMDRDNNDMNEIKKVLENNNKILKENRVIMENMKEAMEKQHERMEKTTYASIAAVGAGRKAPVQTALHSIMITSKDEEETGETVLEKVREAINAKEGWIKVDKIRKTRDKKVVVGCKTVTEREKIKERLKKAEKYLKVEEIKNKDPLLMLKDVFQYNTDGDILKALGNQNREVFKDLKEQDKRIDIKYRIKTRNPHINHVVLTVSPIIWRRALDAEILYIDLQRVKVVDKSPLVQCSLCLGYGHSRRFCKDEVEKCSHCGGSHMRADCEKWRDGAEPSCCNCTKAKMETFDHNAFSQECPVRKKWDALARSNIAYC